MEWIKLDLFPGYTMVGNVDGHIVYLCVEHPNGTKIVKEKHMTQIDVDNCDLDDIRRFFSRHISKVQALSLEQIQLFCGVKAQH